MKAPVTERGEISRRAEILAVAALLAAFIFQAGYHAATRSATFDEGNHFAAGLSALTTGDFNVFPQNPPLVRLIEELPPFLLGARTPQGEGLRSGVAIRLANETAMALGARFQFYLVSARFAAIGLAMSLGLILWFDVRRAFGAPPALAALALYFLQPMIIAHGSLATVDIGAALFFYLAARAYVKGAQWGWTWARVLAAGALAGAAVAAKFSNLSLVLIIPAAWAALGGCRKLRAHGRRAAARTVARGAVGLGVALVVVNAAYFFSGVPVRMKEIIPKSRAVAMIARVVPASLPLPLPREMIRGFDLQSFDNETMGGNRARVFWMGRWVDGPVTFFFAWLLAIKFSPLLLPLAAIGIMAGLRRRSGIELAYLSAALIQYVLVAHVVAMYFSVRYLMGVVPFLVFFAAGGSSAIFSRLPRLVPWLLGAVFVVTAGSAALTFPHYLDYANFIRPADRPGVSYDPDGPRDWGQDLLELKTWMKRNRVDKVYLGAFGGIDPSVYGINWEPPPPEPRLGVWAVSRTWLIKDYTTPFQFPTREGMMVIPRPVPYLSWLASRRPIGMAGSSIFIYEFR